MQYPADPSSSIAASWDYAGRSCEVRRSDVQKTNASTTGCSHLLRMVAADSDNIVMTTMSVDDEYAVHLRSSITASSDLVTAVHWTHSICAQIPVQLSDVHNTNASTSENAWYQLCGQLCGQLCSQLCGVPSFGMVQMSARFCRVLFVTIHMGLTACV